MTRRRHHLLVVEIECLDSQSSQNAADRLKRWIEHNGHTSPGHGFDFIDVHRDLAKAMENSGD